MTVKQFYDACGGGYEEMAAKFPSDALIIRFLKMFERDNNFAELSVKLEEGDAEGAFSAVHNVKGLVLNLNLKGMIEPVQAVTEALRSGDIDTARAYFPELERAYKLVTDNLLNL